MDFYILLAILRMSSYKFYRCICEASPIDSGTSPFTFVPSIWTLPSQVLLAKESNYLPKIVVHKGTLMQKPEDLPEKSLEKNMHQSPQSILNTVQKPSSRGSSLEKEWASKNPEDIKSNDLFIAEFVVVMDDEEDEIIAKKSQTLPFEETKYDFRKTLQQSATGQPKATRAEIKAHEIYVPASQEDCSNVVDQEPQQIYSVPSVGLDSYSPQLSDFSYPDKRALGYRRQITNSLPENIHTPKTAVQDTVHTSLSSQKSNSFQILTTQSPLNSNARRSLYSPTNLEMSEHKTINESGRSNVLSPLPIQVIKYPLCCSPSPLSSPFFGSSSTICSINESTSPIPKPDAASPVSSRLLFLTSLLRSKRSCSKRTLSPDHHYQSKPRTSSLTPSDFHKTITSDAPRKAISCFSLNYPRESKMLHCQRKDEIMPSDSESDILHGEFSFHQRPNRTLSPDSIHCKSSASALLSQKGSVSPSSPLHRRSVTPPYSSREYILSLNDKPPISRLPYTPMKKYSILGKSKRVTLLPPPLHLDQSLRHVYDERKSDMTHLKRFSSPKIPFISTCHDSRKSSYQSSVMSSSSLETEKKYGQTHSALLCNENMDTDQDTYQSLHPSYSCNSFSSENLARKNIPLCSLSTNITEQPRSILSRSCEWPLSQVSGFENKKLYNIKSSYKAFAAIPTNTLLLDQKAIDEPEINTRNTEAEDRVDTHTEMCSPALLRQQTEEICAAIDEVLHNPLSLNCNPASRSSNLKSEKKSTFIPRPPLKSAGRETKYAMLQPLIKIKAKDSQTRPGVIRPMAAKENKDIKLYPNLFQQFSMPPYKRE
ncbi:muscular LMNA-interacting protein [Rhinoderma darwinii]|uniref:muscular LMNA-interacting protein n=1 Tax=Rhinoderma darwinii TaxID=43563 RepID=UPI003F67E99F